MQSLIINGPFKTSGTVAIGGNKNAALPMIAASLLTEDEVILHNVPDILDVENMLLAVKAAGAAVKREGSTVSIKASGELSGDISQKICSATRTSILFAGPLAVRTGSASLWPPGGDVIGRRRLDAHFYGLGKLGIKVDCETTPFKFTKQTAAGRRNPKFDMFLDEASVTATEHIMTTASLTQGTTIIRNAASEPHISQLAGMLCAMGAEISEIDTNTLTIKGAKKLHGCEVTLEGDHIEAASFLALAAATGGSIELTGRIQPRSYWMMRRVFERFGLKFVLKPGRIVMNAQKMKIRPDFGNAVPTLADGPWPQFPSDMMSCMIVAATQARGSVLFFEKMFESRIHFVDSLIAMGANAIVCDPHRVVVSGPAKLRGKVLSCPDIRAGMALIIAGCCAKGVTKLTNADMVFRGYEKLPEKLSALGADITVEEN